MTAGATMTAANQADDRGRGGPRRLRGQPDIIEIAAAVVIALPAR